MKQDYKESMRFGMRATSVFVAICATILLAGCTGNIKETDRDKFIGTWEGRYGGKGTSVIDDQLIIKKNTDVLGFSIRIHATAENPDDVTGTLTRKNVITIPEQSMGGGPGTAKITYLADDTLKFIQKGGGITVKGSGYTKATK